jgi:Protein of unknown function (DUF4043)
MTLTTPATENKVQLWESKFFTEYIRENGFGPYMGKGTNSVIRTNMRLVQDDGESVTIPFIRALAASTGMGTGALEGGEAETKNYGYKIVPVWRRNATLLKKSDQKKSAIDLLDANKQTLKMWCMDDLRNQILNAMSATAVELAPIDDANGVGAQRSFYPGLVNSASAAQNNAYLVANSFRTLFGDKKSNAVAGNFASSLNAITAPMKFTVATAKLAKREAKIRGSLASGRWPIRPIKVEGNREYYVCFLGTGAFRDLSEDTVMVNANRDARAREGASMETNPLFQDGDLIYHGIIFREIPEITTITNAGSVVIEPFYFCGAEALGFAMGQELQSTQRSSTDYGFLTGVGTEELRNVEKVFYNGTAHGVYMGFAAAAADL